MTKQMKQMMAKHCADTLVRERAQDDKQDDKQVEPTATEKKHVRDDRAHPRPAHAQVGGSVGGVVGVGGLA